MGIQGLQPLGCLLLASQKLHVDISSLIARELIQVFKQENACHVVAPYEADAQMTFLAVSKQVGQQLSLRIQILYHSADPGLVICIAQTTSFFTVRNFYLCDMIILSVIQIIFKMDKFGQGVEFQYSMLHRNKDLTFSGFTKQMLLVMCLLSGCNYLKSLPGVGLKKSSHPHQKVIKHTKYSTASVPPLFEESFKKAILTFQHQRVHGSVSQDIVYLSDYCIFVDYIVLELKFCSFSWTTKGFASLEAKTKFRLRGTHLILQVQLMILLSVPVKIPLRMMFRVKHTAQSYPLLTLTTWELNLLVVIEHGLHETKSRKYIVATIQTYSIHKPCLTLHTERECKNAPDTVEGGKTRTEHRKVIVSSHFKDKSINKHNLEDKQEKQLLKDDLAIVMHEDAVPESKVAKRTTSPHDNVQMENVKLKQLCISASLPDDGSCASSLNKTITDTNKEGKFGSNISLLGRYSDIAKKSMERYVSVISSFIFSSSSSHASGLRAPLKDVQNTGTNRPTVDDDFSKFEYRERAVNSDVHSLNRFPALKPIVEEG
ncbi:unnamed protein product [Malus baccata var. baccata]